MTLRAQKQYAELFGLLDDKNVGRIEVGQPLVEIIRVVNPRLAEEAVWGVLEKGGAREVEEGEFVGMMRSLLFNMTGVEREEAVMEVCRGLKDARRRRFLMFSDRVTRPDVNQEELAISLAGSPSALSMYEELYAYGLYREGSALTLESLTQLLTLIAPSQPDSERKEMVKIADTTPDNELDLKEFLILMRAARLPIPLSDMVGTVRKRLSLGLQLHDSFAGARSPPPLRYSADIRSQIKETSEKEQSLNEKRRALLDNQITSRSDGGIGGYRAFEIELDLARRRASAAEDRAADAEQRAAEADINRYLTRGGSEHQELREDLRRFESTHGKSEILDLAKRYDALLAQYTQNPPGSTTIPGIANHTSTGSTSSVGGGGGPSVAFSPDSIIVAPSKQPSKRTVSITEQTTSRLARLANTRPTQRWK